MFSKAVMLSKQCPFFVFKESMCSKDFLLYVALEWKPQNSYSVAGYEKGKVAAMC